METLYEKLASTKTLIELRIHESYLDSMDDGGEIKDRIRQKGGEAIANEVEQACVPDILANHDSELLRQVLKGNTSFVEFGQPLLERSKELEKKLEEAPVGTTYYQKGMFRPVRSIVDALVDGKIIDPYELFYDKKIVSQRKQKMYDLAGRLASNTRYIYFFSIFGILPGSIAVGKLIGNSLHATSLSLVTGAILFGATTFYFIKASDKIKKSDPKYMPKEREQFTQQLHYLDTMVSKYKTIS